jgi:uncharacterized protein (DUF885 family)
MPFVSRRDSLKLGAAFAATTGLASVSACSTAGLRPDGARQANAAFEALSAKWLKDSARTRPSWATALGDHAFDSELTDMSPSGRAARTAVTAETHAALRALELDQLTSDNQLDALMLRDALAAADFSANALQDWAWDPLVYSDLVGGSLYALMARDFAPLPERLLSAAARMEKLPELLSQARSQLDPARTPLIHAQTWAKQNPGATAIIDELIAPNATALGAGDRARLLAAAESARQALRAHQVWIETDLIAQAAGDFRLGAALFDPKLRWSVDAATPRADIRRQAEADLERVTSEMYDIARTVLATRSGAAALPETASADRKRAAVLDALAIAAADRSPRMRLFQDVEASLASQTRFVRDRDLITLPDAPVKVIEMPKFQQGVAVAYCDSPGPLDRRLETFYAVSPIPSEWTQEQADSYLREYNRRSVEELSIHEAMPGHYVQIWHANKHPSVLRAVLGSGTFIEGWACYAQDMMIEAGHGGDDPLRRLVNLKWALRVIANAILDQGVHVDGWDEGAAMRFMTGAAFQEEREAAGKWTRARVSSGQLSTYYVGWTGHHALRREVKAREGASFDLKTYHDGLLSHGSPPLALVRSLMLGLPLQQTA